MFGSKVVGSPSCSLVGKRTTQENAKDNSRHFWPQCGVQKRLCCGCLQDIAQCCIRGSERFSFVQSGHCCSCEMFVVSSFTFPSAEKLLWKTMDSIYTRSRKLLCCSLYWMDWTDWKYFNLTNIFLFFPCACMLIQEQYLSAFYTVWEYCPQRWTVWQK